MALPCGEGRGTLRTDQEVAAAVLAAGFTGQTAVQFVALTHTEASNYDQAVGCPGDGHQYVGLWQIADVHYPDLIAAGIIRQPSDLFDVGTNARAAKWVYDRQGLTVNSWESIPQVGPYMAQAAAAIDQARKNGAGPGTGQTGATGQTGGADTGGTDPITAGINSALGWTGDVATSIGWFFVRVSEVVWGAVMIGTGVLIIVDVIGFRRPGTGAVAKGAGQAVGVVKWAKRAAEVAA